MTNLVLILTTVPDRKVGDRIAEALVGERLAACVNVYGVMASVYRWRGVVERESEHQVVIKTTADRVDAIRTRMTDLHTYELPEFLVVPVADGGADYLRWVEAETRESATLKR